MPTHSPSPTWNHPLFGADPGTLAKALAGNGPLPAAVWPLAAAMLAVSLARSPFSLCEALAAARLRRAPRPAAPVFILGHWRSGTTHLFNLMSRDSRFAWADPFSTGMPWDFLLLGRLLRSLLARALPARRYIDAVAVNPDSPQEDEIALASMQGLSYYHGIYFPRRFEQRYRRSVFGEQVRRRELERWRRRFAHYHGKCLSGKAGGTLLVKNPAYTGRVALLRELFPDARFIHIHRNPYVVFESTRRFYRALLPRLALQHYDDNVADDLVLEGYPRMIDALYADTADLAPGRFVELRFEDLEGDPLGRLEYVYRSLELPGYRENEAVFRRYLDSIAGYEKNEHALGDDVRARVDRHWGGLVRRWGYDHPA